ncbi:hypothetical protein NWF32_14850 [Pseudomonas qingdaonensis]|nr:hypothetical protein [Pseudomonas qingdaonensis]
MSPLTTRELYDRLKDRLVLSRANAQGEYIMAEQTRIGNLMTRT